MVVLNNAENAWDPKCDVALQVVHAMGQQLKLMIKVVRSIRLNVQDIKVTNPLDELIKCLPHETAFRSASKHMAHLKFMEDLHWYFNPKILPYLKGNIFGVILYTR